MKKQAGKWLNGKEGFFSLLRKERRDTLINLGLILVLGSSVSLLMTLYLDRIPQRLVVGSIAGKDIKADQNYEIVDEKSTQKLKEEAVAGILPVYDFDPTIETEVISRIHGAFNGARTFLQDNLPQGGRVSRLSEELESTLKREFQESLAFLLTDEQYDLVHRNRFHPAVERALTWLIHDVMQYPVAQSLADFSALVEKGFSLRKLSPDGNSTEEVVNEASAIQGLQESRNKILSVPLKSGERDLNLEFLDRDTFQGIKSIVAGLVKTNVNYNGSETDSRKLKAQANIKNIIVKVQRGEAIIRGGDRFEPWHLTVIEGIRKQRMKTNRPLKFAGTFLFVNLVFFIVYYYSAKYIRKFRPNRKDLVFLGVTLILCLVILRVGVFLGATVRDALPFSVGPFTLYYVIPVAAGAMLVRFILNSETALVFAVLLSLFSGIFVENSLELTVYYLISGVFAAHAIAHVDKRSTILLCGAYTGLVNALTVFSLNLISVISISGGIEPSQIAVNAVAGFFGGLFTAMTVLVLTPVMEGLFNYTTDIKLLELANLSHPLLKEMIVHAPGTYHHSQLVGILAEAGAQAINANPLLARVGSYYHDIGKMKKPQYFVENQRGDNPHDKLAPSMSALIVEAHVKDGLEMAREYKLPKKIADMIPQHQGTKLIGYFYNKARKTADPALGKVDERDYRYEGPKPQTREAGIIMLADTVEAAVRSLPEKTPQKIQSTVEKLVNQHFVDEQLDECDLTLRDLHRIAEAFGKILVGIYHQRVEYPEGALLAEGSAGANIHPLWKRSKVNDALLEQPTPPQSNIAPLFRKKGEKNPSSS
ncbi:MAG: HDIG domain-containing protein [Deltaproteobacteria bacterium]|nr:HDIG domain-containing protein [Deltaproteobacteria bacterium]